MRHGSLHPGHRPARLPDLYRWHADHAAHPGAGRRQQLECAVAGGRGQWRTVGLCHRGGVQPRRLGRHGVQRRLVRLGLRPAPRTRRPDCHADQPHHAQRDQEAQRRLDRNGRRAAVPQGRLWRPVEHLLQHRHRGPHGQWHGAGRLGLPRFPAAGVRLGAGVPLPLDHAGQHRHALPLQPRHFTGHDEPELGDGSHRVQRLRHRAQRRHGGLRAFDLQRHDQGIELPVFHRVRAACRLDRRPGGVLCAVGRHDGARAGAGHRLHPQRGQPDADGGRRCCGQLPDRGQPVGHHQGLGQLFGRHPAGGRDGEVLVGQQ